MTLDGGEGDLAAVSRLARLLRRGPAMNVGLGHIGALVATYAGTVSLAARPAPTVRPVEKPGELPKVQPLTKSLDDPRERIREQVLAERGLDVASVMALPAMARIQLETLIEGEVARRLGAHGGHLLDIRT